MACASAANYQPASVCLCHAGAAETRSTVPAMLAVLPEWLCTERPSTHDDCGWCRLPPHAYAEVHELYSPWMSLFLPWRTVLTLDSGGCVWCVLLCHGGTGLRSGSSSWTQAAAAAVCAPGCGTATHSRHDMGCFISGCWL